MFTINIDNLTAFYLGMSIVTLAFAILVVFGKTEDRNATSGRKR